MRDGRNRVKILNEARGHCSDGVVKMTLRRDSRYSNVAMGEDVRWGSLRLLADVREGRVHTWYGRVEEAVQSFGCRVPRPGWSCLKV